MKIHQTVEAQTEVGYQFLQLWLRVFEDFEEEMVKQNR
jgi:hypothetical protein